MSPAHVVVGASIIMPTFTARNVGSRQSQKFNLEMMMTMTTTTTMMMMMVMMMMMMMMIFFFFFFCQAHHSEAFNQKHSSIITMFLSLTHSLALI